MSDTLNDDVKVIYSNVHRIDNPDDPSLPYKLEAAFSHGDFMRVTAVLLYGGSQRFVLRGRTEAALRAAVIENEWLTHPRLIRLEITGPDGVVTNLCPVGR